MNAKPWLSYFFIALYCIVAVYLNYFTVRSDFTQVILLFGGLFVLYFGILKSELKLNHLLIGAVVARACLLFSEPNLSDDVYRFIWDGRVSANEMNPFLFTPDYFVQEISLSVKGLSESLYTLLNSKQYYTVYPAFAQYLFTIAAALDIENLKLSIIIFKLLLLVSEIALIKTAILLLNAIQLNERNVLLYAFNPLVVIEIMGNAHFETVMICFLLLGFWAMHKKKISLSAIMLAISVSTKMLPLMFAPLLLRYLNIKQIILFALVSVMTIVILFAPFYNIQIFTNLFSSVDLFLQSFEFNASIYYIIRKIGYLIYDFNIIKMIGHWIPMIVLSIFLIITALVKKLDTKELIKYCLLFISIHFFFATTVHPWYISSLVALSIFTSFRYPIIWSAMAILSYAAYANEPFSENLTFVAIEYLCVFGAFFYEIWAKKPVFSLLEVTGNAK